MVELASERWQEAGKLMRPSWLLYCAMPLRLMRMRTLNPALQLSFGDSGELAVFWRRRST